MAETSQRTEFRFIVEEADDGQLEAWCIDAGAVGVGPTILAAVTDMTQALEAMYQVCKDGSATMYVDPASDELALFNDALAGRPGVPGDVVGAGVVSRRERREHGKVVHVGFDAANLHVLGAA